MKPDRDKIFKALMRAGQSDRKSEYLADFLSGEDLLTDEAKREEVAPDTRVTTEDRQEVIKR